LYCGIDLHAQAMYVGILDQKGDIMLHRNMQTTPETFLTVIAPERDSLVVAVAWMFPWYWLAALGAEAGIPFVLGPALSMPAIHGGKAKHDQSASHPIAVLLRGGRLPQASGSPATMRATRDLLRRRMPLAHTRGEFRAPGQKPTRQYPLPAIGTKLASQATRDGGAERFADPAGQKSLEVARALSGYDGALLRAVALTILTTATHHDATTLALLHTVPGMGPLLSLVLLYASPEINRFPRGQECASSCRLVKWAPGSNGNRAGTSGATIGQAPLQGAGSEAAVLFLREHPPGQTCLARLEQKHDPGKALTLFAHPLARAVYDLFPRQTALAMQRFFHGAGRGVRALDASRDNQGLTLTLPAPPCITGGRLSTPRSVEGVILEPAA
jgi:hypothetical protein